MTLKEQLTARFPQLTFLENEPLARYTTVGIGGPAEVFCRVSQTPVLQELCSVAHTEAIPLTILGWGANTLISDAGIRGLVIKNECSEVTVHEELPPELAPSITVAARYSAEQAAGSFKYAFSDLDLDESQAERVLVTCAAGVGLPTAINVLLSQGITGLQWYSRIPASIGGAVYNNIHGGTHFLSEIIHTITVLTTENTVLTLSAHEAEFGYDSSRFHTSGEVILSVTFLLYRGDAEKAKVTAREWAVRKKLQPQSSLGCVFQNITPEEQARLGFSTPSIGYIIEHKLGLQGKTIGGARISLQHAAFIENTGTATAADYVSLIRLISEAAATQLHIQLKPEIFFKGFTPQELAGIV